MLTLTIIRRNGVALSDGATATFDLDGGTLGRADTNRLVLEDPERTVSRIHAQISGKTSAGGDAFVLLNRGSNPLLINGTPIDPGQQTPIADRDELQIGGYLLRASLRASASADVDRRADAPRVDDPFADMLGTPLHADIASDVQSNAVPKLPFAADALDDLLRSGTDAAAECAAPFALPDDFGLDAPQLAGSIDELFGLHGSDDHAQREHIHPTSAPMRSRTSCDPRGDALVVGDMHRDIVGCADSDPHADRAARLIGDPFAEPLSAPNTAHSSDPFASLCGAAPAHAPPAPMRDDSLELHGAFRPPREHQQTAAAAHAAVLPAENGPASLDASLDASRTAALNASPNAPLNAAIDAPFAATRSPVSSAPASAPMRASGSASPGPCTQPTDALRDAFLRGLNVDDARLGPLTPELLERVGALLREATQGTLDLLAARAATRVELHANVTLIAPQQNNPLKFSPNPQAALGHLLHAPIRGFMDGPAALGDAYADLRAHQIGYVAGVKAALDGLVERFSPHTLEQRLSPPTLRDSLLPGARRARCWDAFVALYDEIAHEAVDNFHTMLNQAFVDAYDRQVERLRPRK